MRQTCLVLLMWAALLVSVSSVGKHRLGEQVIAGLRP